MNLENKKTIAIMQPYFFPYIGYFQMINAVDEFVFYDDVNFIKRGWINRNRILVNTTDFVFTVPLKKISQNNLILESEINQEEYAKWKSKFIQTLSQSYKNANYKDEVLGVVAHTLKNEYKTISELAIESIESVCHYLDMKTSFSLSSLDYAESRGMEKQSRLIDICKQAEATHYINAIGGQELYTKETFAKEGIQLSFIKPKPIQYKQFKNEFVPWLSIIDVLMFNSKEEVRDMLKMYELL